LLKLNFWIKKISLMGRYDRLNRNRFSGVVSSERIIAGFSYHFVHKCKLLIDYDLYKSDRNLSQRDGIFEIATEVVF